MRCCRSQTWSVSSSISTSCRRVIRGRQNRVCAASVLPFGSFQNLDTQSCRSLPQIAFTGLGDVCSSWMFLAGRPGFCWGQSGRVAPEIDRPGPQPREPKLVRLFLPGSGKLLDLKVDQPGLESCLRPPLDWAAPAAVPARAPGQWRLPPPAGYCIRQLGANQALADSSIQDWRTVVPARDRVTLVTCCSLVGISQQSCSWPAGSIRLPQPRP